MFRAVITARRFKPDFVVGGSGLVAPMVLAASRACGARSAVYVHGLDLAVRHSLYRAAWIPALQRVDRVVANSNATKELACVRAIKPARIRIVHPGVSLPSVDPAARARFRAQHGFGAAPVLLSVGRLTTRKGLREFVSSVLPQIVRRHPDLVLAVIGDAPTDALYATVQTPKSIVAAAEQAGVAANLRFLGKRFGQELEDAYAGADVHVFPVRVLPDDPEGFGMVALEAAAHGLPTVAYATGGVVDAVRNGISGLLVAAGNEEGFASAVLELLEAPLPEGGAAAFASEFTWEEFGSQLERALFDGEAVRVPGSSGGAC